MNLMVNDGLFQKQGSCRSENVKSGYAQEEFRRLPSVSKALRLWNGAPILFLYTDGSTTVNLVCYFPVWAIKREKLRLICFGAGMRK